MIPARGPQTRFVKVIWGDVLKGVRMDIDKHVAPGWLPLLKVKVVL